MFAQTAHYLKSSDEIACDNENARSLRTSRSGVRVPCSAPSMANKKDDKGSNSVDTPFEPLALCEFFSVKPKMTFCFLWLIIKNIDEF